MAGRIGSRRRRVALNATETGERSLLPAFDFEAGADPPFDALVRGYCDNIVDVFQRPNTRLYSWLKPRLASRRVRGIVLWHFTGCDLWRGEAQTLRETFGLPGFAARSRRGTGRRPARTQPPPGFCGIAPMNAAPRKLSLDEWDGRYEQLRRDGLREPAYGGPLRRHVVREKDFRLQQLQFDNSPAALRLWNFLLTENERLHQARAGGHKIVGAMKDLGTVPVMAYALPGVRAFYPDGAWWTPCLMECSDQLLQQAERMGIDASFCPVRAMLPAFENGRHFPRPDLLVCSAGAVCDDFSAIAQRLEHLGHSIFWWEIPRRRQPDPGETGLRAAGPPRRAENSSGLRAGGIAARRPGAGRTGRKNPGRRLFGRRHSRGQSGAPAAALVAPDCLSAPAAPLPALEMLVAEMLAIHFCSDREETIAVLDGLLAEVQARARREPVCVRRRGRADFLGQSGRGFARDELAGGTRRTPLRFGLSCSPTRWI